MPLTKSRRQQRAHAAIHPLCLAHAFLRAHRAQDRKLAFVGLAIKRWRFRRGHERTLRFKPSIPSKHVGEVRGFAANE